MTVNRAVSSFAGCMILLSLALAHVWGQIDLSRLGWLWLTAFVGANLFRMGFTGFCPAAKNRQGSRPEGQLGVGLLLVRRA